MEFISRGLLGNDLRSWSASRSSEVEIFGMFFIKLGDKMFSWPLKEHRMDLAISSLPAS